MQSDLESDGSQPVDGSRQRRWWLGGGRGKAQLLRPIQDDASADILIPTWIGPGLGETSVRPMNAWVGHRCASLWADASLSITAQSSPPIIAGAHPHLQPQLQLSFLLGRLASHVSYLFVVYVPVGESVVSDGEPKRDAGRPA